MTAQEIIKAVLDFMGLIVSWPVLILILVFMFRKRAEEAIGVLTERLKSVSIGGAKAEFDSADAALIDRNSGSDESEYTESPDGLRGVNDLDSSEDETEISELHQRIENLGK